MPGREPLRPRHLGDLKRRVDGLLAAGPVDLTICGPEAAANVAAIEAGLLTLAVSHRSPAAAPPAAAPTRLSGPSP